MQVTHVCAGDSIIQAGIKEWTVLCTYFVSF